MATYIVRMKNKYTWGMDIPEEAGAHVWANFHDLSAEEDWQRTPLQAADAHHDVRRTAKMVWRHFDDGDGDEVVAEVEEIKAEEN